MLESTGAEVPAVDALGIPDKPDINYLFAVLRKYCAAV